MQAERGGHVERVAGEKAGQRQAIVERAAVVRDVAALAVADIFLGYGDAHKKDAIEDRDAEENEQNGDAPALV